MRKGIGLWLWKPPSCKPSILCVIPLVRSDCGSGVCIPLSVEVIVVVWLSALSLNCEVDLVWLCALPLSVEVVFERGVVYSQVVFA